ncbi:hypothetical protein DZF91_30865 [Actinomadura logoneensis]|uniref:Uncharacterized protein n=1 Tax=Actinomadura logoneensis TaxID=2293572 RepID=A0A372JDC8_9ACTN|nr:hypothetical protein [Actinomadura logoneensis]RFU37826.1 hypothetical protein DZF91_30865 [Actinomadura logoneensis]
MKYLIAAALTFAGGALLSFVAFGEAAFSLLGLVGVPGLLVLLFLVPALSSGRSAELGRIGLGAALLVVVGVSLLAAFAPKYAVLLALVAGFGLLAGWPLAASAALLMAVASVRAGRSRAAAAPGGARVWSRMAWTSVLALAATYGFGLSHLDDDMRDVKDRVCRYTSEGASAGHTGGQSLLPLSDTTCGPDTVPGFVNPLLVVLATLLVLCVGAYCGARLRTRTPRPAA